MITARRRLPEPLREPAFRALWSAGLISDSGDWVLFIALPVLTYRITGSAGGTATAFLAELLPGALVAPLGGRLADRLPRRVLLVSVSLAQAAALLPLLTVHTRGDLPVLFGVIVAQAALQALFDPAKNALLPELIDAAQRTAANGLIGLNQNLGRLIGGPLGGVLLAVGGLPVVVTFDAASFVLAAALLCRVRVAGPCETSVPEPDRAADAQDRRTLRRALAVSFVAQVAQGLFVVLFVLYVAQRLHGGEAETGLLRGVQAVGAIGGGIVLAVAAGRHCAVDATPPARADWRLVMWGALVFAVLELLLWNLPAVTTALPVYVVLFVLVGAPGICYSTGLVSLVQAASTAAGRGRAFGRLGVATYAGEALGMGAAGLLTERLGLLPMLNAQALIYLGAAVLAAAGLSGHAAGRASGRALTAGD